MAANGVRLLWVKSNIQYFARFGCCLKTIQYVILSYIFFLECNVTLYIQSGTFNIFIVADAW